RMDTTVGALPPLQRNEAVADARPPGFLSDRPPLPPEAAGLRFAPRSAEPGWSHGPPGPTLDAVSTTWAPGTWRDRPAAQQPSWPDESALDAVLKQLSTLPPLVFAGEARLLTSALSDVANG